MHLNETRLELNRLRNKAAKAYAPVPHRPLSQIAAEMNADWTALHGAAQPYMDAMSELEFAADRCGVETGSDIIQGFLNNAQTWRGEVARRVKEELRAILRDHPPL